MSCGAEDADFDFPYLCLEQAGLLWFATAEHRNYVLPRDCHAFVVIRVLDCVLSLGFDVIRDPSLIPPVFTADIEAFLNSSSNQGRAQ